MVTRMHCPAIEGTLYLKRAYQKNMVAALVIGVFIHLAAIGTYTYMTNPVALNKIIKTVSKGPDGNVFELPPPPPIGEQRDAQIYREVQKTLLKFG